MAISLLSQHLLSNRLVYSWVWASISNCTRCLTWLCYVNDLLLLASLVRVMCCCCFCFVFYPILSHTFQFSKLTALFYQFIKIVRWQLNVVVFGFLSCTEFIYLFIYLFFKLLQLVCDYLFVCVKILAIPLSGMGRSFMPANTIVSWHHENQTTTCICHRYKTAG